MIRKYPYARKNVILFGDNDKIICIKQTCFSKNTLIEGFKQIKEDNLVKQNEDCVQ